MKPFLLEQGSIADLKPLKKRVMQLIEAHWHLYSELARQRNEIKEQISQALMSTCASDYEFKHWQRALG